MELSPSSEAASCAATQELHSNIWNPNVHSTPPHPVSLRSILIPVSILLSVGHYIQNLSRSEAFMTWTATPFRLSSYSVC
jgi:hypothetical protein